MKNIDIRLSRKKGYCYLIIISALLIFILDSCNNDSSGPSGMNISGSWRIEETIDGNCAGKAYPYDEMDIVAIKQVGSSLTIVYSSLGTNFTGSLVGNTITFSGEYDEEDGTNTINFTGTLSENGTGFTGTATWTWSDGEYSCSGTADVSATKVSQVITDIEGEWTGIWESDDGYTEGGFSVNINQTNTNLSGTISVPVMGMDNAELEGTFSGNSILFGDIEDEIVFYGVAESETSLVGCYKLTSFNEEGTWSAEKVFDD